MKSCLRISSIATALGLIIAALSRQWEFLLLEGLGSGWEALGSSYTEAALCFLCYNVDTPTRMEWRAVRDFTYVSKRFGLSPTKRARISLPCLRRYSLYFTLHYHPTLLE